MNCGERDSSAARRSRRIAHLPVAAALALILLSPAASAADLSDAVLRGTFWNPPVAQPYGRWDGINFGVQLGYSNLSADFGNATSSQIAYILRNSTLENEFQPSNWTTLPKGTTNSKQFGFFLGYNWQMEQLVFGFDAAYNRPSSLSSMAEDAIRRIATTSDTIQHDVTVQSSACSSSSTTPRCADAPATPSASSCLTPCSASGVGRFNYSAFATVTDVQTPPVGGGTQTRTNSQDNIIMAGFVTGLGMDVAVLLNVFLRAGPVNGIKSSLNTGRVGLGLKF